MAEAKSINYWGQLGLLLGLVGTCMVAGGFLVQIIGALALNVPMDTFIKIMNEPAGYGKTMGWLNALGAVFIFLLPVFIWAKVLSKASVFRYLGFNRGISFKQIICLLLIGLGAFYLSGALSTFSQLIPLHNDWKIWATELEEQYQKTVLAVAAMNNLSDLFQCIILLALVPAICEELLFRSGFQKIFIGLTRSRWVGILITAAFFSAVHFSFYGFLSRMALGAVLGFVYYYSKNIWLAIIMHFFNNAFIVVMLYLSVQKGMSVSQAMDESAPVWVAPIAFLVIYSLFIFYRKESAMIGYTEEVILIDKQTKDISMGYDNEHD